MNLSRFKSPALLLGLSALFSRLLGLLRDHLLAKTFGATSGEGIYNLDTYLVAFKIPDLLYNLLVFGAISAAFIPLFVQYKKKDQLKKAWEFASNMLHLMLVLMLIFSIIAYFLAPVLVKLIAPGFEPEAMTLTSRLMKILLISPILFTFSAVLTSLQDSFKTFFFRSLAPLFYNLGIIFGILFFGHTYGVVGVTWGVIIGAALQLLVQLPALKQIGYKHVWILNFKKADVRKAFSLMLPRIIGLSLNQLTILVNNSIGSLLITGSITVFYFADNLQNLPLSMFAISYAITSFATFSELAEEKNPDAFSKEIQSVMEKILFLIIPAMFGLLLLRYEIIDLIFVGGEFTQADGRLTANTFALLLASAFAQSLIPVLARGFYAYQNTKTPVITALIGSVISLSMAYFLAIILGWGVPGIAAGFSVGMILNALLLYIFMSRYLGRQILGGMKLFKMIFSSGVMFLVTWLLKGQLTYQGVFFQRFSFLLIIAFVGVVIYFGLTRVLGLKEAKMVWGNFGR